jgi:hypothetical protein
MRRRNTMLVHVMSARASLVPFPLWRSSAQEAVTHLPPCSNPILVENKKRDRKMTFVREIFHLSFNFT